MKYKYLKHIVGGVFVALVFVIFSLISQAYSNELQYLTEQSGFFGVVSYVGIMMASIVVAPIGTAFLLPVAANSWGPFLASLYSIIGWTIGSMISFYLARKYGYKMLNDSKTVQRMREVEMAIPKRNMFMIVVFLRMALPVDLLSYALGLFSNIGYKMFFWSTIIGISPFAFMFSYAAISSVWTQIEVLLFGVLVFLGGIYYVFQNNKSIGDYKNKEE